MSEVRRIERVIEVVIHEHKITHLLVATSKDVPGLYIAARSEEQIRDELPGVIREMLELQGLTVHDVGADFQKAAPSGFEVRSMVARAMIDDLVAA